jgi:hypothetical protein
VGIICGLIYGNVIEYLVHRYLYHGLGKAENSAFGFHLREHHLISRKNGFYDTKASALEQFGAPILAMMHFPTMWISPGFFFGTILYGILFSIVHTFLHHHPKFSQKYFWWHWNHHMKNQNQSWNVVFPLTDWLTGTLEKRSRNR